MREFLGTAPGLIGLRAKTTKCPKQLDPWQNSRKVEDFRLQREADVQEQQRCKLRSQWEEQTQQSQIEAETLRRFYAIKEQERQQLEKRRDQLEVVRLIEEQEFTSEQKSPMELIKDRYEQLRRQAEQLERERQEADRKIAQEKYEQQFRESCDPLRGELSRRKAYEIAEDRRVQIAMKQEQRKRELEEAVYFTELLKKHAESTTEDEIKKTKASSILVEQLQKQIREKEASKMEIERQKMKEKENLMQLRKELHDEILKSHERKLEQRAKVRSDLDECLREKREKQAKEMKESQLFDNLLSHLTDELEQKNVVADKDVKDRAKKEALQYLEYIRQTRTEEAVFEQHVNKVVDEAIEREAKRINDARLREKAAREKLAQETANVCRQQMQRKAEEFKKQVEKKRTDAIELQASIEKDGQKTLEELANHRNRLLEYRQALEAQMAHQDQFVMAAEKEAERERRSEQEAEINMKRHIEEVLNSQEDSTNRHPWRILFA